MHRQMQPSTAALNRERKRERDVTVMDKKYQESLYTVISCNLLKVFVK